MRLSRRRVALELLAVTQTFVVKKALQARALVDSGLVVYDPAHSLSVDERTVDGNVHHFPVQHAAQAPLAMRSRDAATGSTVRVRSSSADTSASITRFSAPPCSASGTPSRRRSCANYFARRGNPCMRPGLHSLLRNHLQKASARPCRCAWRFPKPRRTRCLRACRHAPARGEQVLCRHAAGTVTSRRKPAGSRAPA